MSGNDACNLIKIDLEAGTWTNYKSAPNIYIQDEDVSQGGNVYIGLYDGRRDPIQAYNGTIIYTNMSCTIEIVTTNTTDRDNIYNDVDTILKATNRSYILNRVDDEPNTPNLFRIIIEVSFIN